MDAFDKVIAHLDGPPRVTQAAFAKRVKAHQSEVSLWYRRLRKPSAKYIPVLRRILGTSLEDWLEAKVLELPGGRRRAA